MNDDAAVKQVSESTGYSEEIVEEIINHYLETKHINDIVTRHCHQVARFNDKILGLPIPKTPKMIEDPRKKFCLQHLHEELNEFAEAKTLEEQADAMIDLTYIALGRIYEMGLHGKPLFDEVHRANMNKQRGEKETRSNSGGYDAIKPMGWRGPNLERIITAQEEALRISPIYHEITKLRKQKGKDYNDGFEINDYFPFGHESYAQMLYMKVTRFISLVNQHRKGQTPNFEGIRDTVLDLLNYATYYLENLDDGKVK